MTGRFPLALLAGSLLLTPGDARSEPVAVRFPEGLVHGFLRLSTLDGRALADGDLLQVARGDRVTSRLVFRFRDGSSSEETAVFTQRGHFRLVSSRLVQKGPAFETPIDARIDVGSGRVVVRYTEDGEEKTETEQMTLPPDLANGLILVLLKNLDPGAGAATVSMLALTPKPRLVELRIERGADEPFRLGGTSREAIRYLVKVDIGGIAGVMASLLGKEPPDSSVWILGGEAPAFVKSESPMFAGGPLWRIELVSPVWPGASGG
jgi:hypothetical protein